MLNFSLMAALILLSLSESSLSVSESQTVPTVEVQVGESVTLTSSNISHRVVPTYWFRLVNKRNMSCITVMSSPTSTVNYCEGIQTKKFKMWTNMSTIYLNITRVEELDSGLYFCGYYTDGRPVTTAISLNIKGSHEQHDDTDSKCKNESDGITKLTSVILGALTVCLVTVVIGLIVKIKKLQTANKEDQNPEHSENVASEELNYAAVTFQRKAKRRELEPHVIYSSRR